MIHDKFCENNDLGCGEYFCDSPCICEIVANVRFDERKQIQAIINRVYNLHAPCDCGISHTMCHECDQDYPCETIKQLEGTSESNYYEE